MASIFKKSGSPFWFAAYRDAHGVRRQKTTKTKDRGKAIDLARAWERLAESGRKGTLTEAIARAVLSQLVFECIQPLDWMLQQFFSEGCLKQGRSEVRYRPCGRVE